MKKTTILFSIILFSQTSFGAGPAGEIVSLNCSKAISSALEYIKKQNIKINVSLKLGELACITPNKKEIVVRLQSPTLKASDKKHSFIINTNTYEVNNHTFSR